MRDIRTGVCPLCEHGEIVQGVPGDFLHDGEAPAAFTYGRRWLLGGRDASKPYGLLTFFMRRACGFVQWFVIDPGAVPVGDDYQTRAVPRDPGPAGSPFR